MKSPVKKPPVNQKLLKQKPVKKPLNSRGSQQAWDEPAFTYRSPRRGKPLLSWLFTTLTIFVLIGCIGAGAVLAWSAGTGNNFLGDIGFLEFFSSEPELEDSQVAISGVNESMVPDALNQPFLNELGKPPVGEDNRLPPNRTPDVGPCY